jgi:hypothetical protein
MKYKITNCLVCKEQIVVVENESDTVCNRLHCVLHELPHIFDEQPELQKYIALRELQQKEEKKLQLYGQPDVARGIKTLRELLDSPLPKKKEKYERFAVYRLIQMYGAERIEKAIRFAFKIRLMPYAPSIYSYTDLEEKWKKLEDFGIKHKNKLVEKSKGAFHENL